MKLGTFLTFIVLVKNTKSSTSVLANPLISVFDTLGTYNTTTHAKTYYVPRFFENSWTQALVLCTSFGLKMLTFNDAREQSHFLDLFNNNKFVKKTWIMHIGGIRSVRTKSSIFYWIEESGVREISHDLSWSEGEPNSDDQPCLSLYKHSGYLLSDSRCNDEIGAFICEEIKKIETPN